MATGGKKRSSGKNRRITRYTHDDVKEPRTPETRHAPLLPADEQIIKGGRKTSALIRETGIEWDSRTREQ